MERGLALAEPPRISVAAAVQRWRNERAATYNSPYMSPRRIAILTGGGDVPGLNSVIKSVVFRGAENGIEVTGIRRGWEGLTHVNLNDPESRKRYILPLDRDNTRTIDRDGGTMLHTSRTNPSKMKKLPDFLAGNSFAQNDGRYDMSARVLENLESL